MNESNYEDRVAAAAGEIRNFYFTVPLSEVEEGIKRIIREHLPETTATVRDMSMRDHFASMAMQPLVAKISIDSADADEAIGALAPAAYEFADLMLAERTKQTEASHA